MTATPHRWIARSLALALALGVTSLVIGAFSTACGPACNTSGKDPIVYKDGTTSAGTYQSTDANGTWLHYPPGRRYRFMHGLGTDKLAVFPYLAFDAHPLHADGGAGDSSPGAGNAVQIEAQTKDYVQLRNDTCAEYYLRVVILSLEAPASANDAGTD